MPVASKNTAILFEQYALTGLSNSVQIGVNVGVLDTTPFGVDAMTSIPNLPASTIEHGGYFTTPDAGALERSIYDELGGAGDVVLAILLGTNVAACPAYVLPTAWGGQLTLSSAIATVLQVAGTWQAGATTVLRRGLRVFSGTISATGETDSVDLGAAGSAGGDAYLFVQAIAGTATGATVDVESSATEGGVYASEGTFTFSAVGSVAIALTGTVNRWVRLNATSLGGATSFAVVGIVGVNGVTQ